MSDLMEDLMNGKQKFELAEEIAILTPRNVIEVLQLVEVYYKLSKTKEQLKIMVMDHINKEVINGY